MPVLFMGLNLAFQCFAQFDILVKSLFIAIMDSVFALPFANKCVSSAKISGVVSKELTMLLI